jgi:hypothetical protein
MTGSTGCVSVAAIERQTDIHHIAVMEVAANAVSNVTDEQL